MVNKILGATLIIDSAVFIKKMFCEFPFKETKFLAILQFRVKFLDQNI